MAVLSVYTDRVASMTLVGAVWGGATNVTQPHSLGTNPDYVFPIPVSVQSATANPGFGALRGNASLNTIQVFGSSVAGASQPTMAFDVIAVFVHSIVR